MGIALVTGGSRGIGWATALQLVREGYTVAASSHHNIRTAMEVVDVIVATGGKVFTLQADISDESQAVAVFESIDHEGELLTTLVNNAGVSSKQSTMESLTAERINRVLTTNVTGCLLRCQEAVERMLFKHGRQGGTIVNVSSAASRFDVPFEYVDYAASKGAMDTFITGLALEVTT